ncbi:MAG: metalloregulator ArsR/SmtB family transcription factor [Thermoanaerobaculia bacterium]
MNPDDRLLARIAERLKALADPTRLKILHALEPGELCVTDILQRVGGSQANISKHLAVLRRTGVVASRREGTSVFYRPLDPTTFAICRMVCDALEEQTAREHRFLKRARAAAGTRR